MTLPGIRDVIQVHDDEYVVVSEQVGAGARRLTLTQVRNGAEDEVKAISDVYPVSDEALVLVAQDHWWYSRAYKNLVGSNSRVFFISGIGSGVGQSVVDTHRRRPIVWLPLRGRTPAGVLLSDSDDLSSIVADEISESGVKTIGSFPTTFPGSGLLSSAAERLPDGRIALFSPERPMGAAARFMLRLFTADGHVVEKQLPCAKVINGALMASVDAEGRVGVVGLSAANEVVAMLINPDQPEQVLCRVISPPGETAATIDRGSPTIVAADHEFFAGWIRSDDRLRLCQFNHLDTAPIVISAGDDADTWRGLGTLIRVNDNETLTLTWRTDRGIAIRRMPQAVAGFALLWEVEQLRCDLMKSLLR